MNRKIKIRSIQASLVFTGLVLFLLFYFKNKEKDEVSSINSVSLMQKNELGKN